MNRKIAINTLFTLISLIFLGSVRFLFNLTIARGFDEEILGIANIALGTGLIFTAIVETSFAPAASKFLAEFRGSKKKDSFVFIEKISLIAPIVLLASLVIILLIIHTWFAKFLGISTIVYLTMCGFIIMSSMRTGRK